MKVIYELVTILLIYSAGYALSLVLPVPGSLLSMGIFFILLVTRILKSERYTRFSSLILRNLAFFFIPPAVKIIDSMGVLSGNIFKLTIVIVLSNICVMTVTGIVVQLFLKKEHIDD